MAPVRYFVETFEESLAEMYIRIAKIILEQEKATFKTFLNVFLDRDFQGPITNITERTIAHHTI
jgi:hypothetical protein